MPKTPRPTKEELEAEAQRILEEAEALKDEPIVDDEDEENKEPEEEGEEENPEEKEEEGEEEPEKEEEEAEPSKEVKEKLKEEVKEKDKKLSASARENQKIYAKNRVINQALIEADDIPEPTEDELRAEYPDYDEMSDVERKLAIETVVSRNWRTVISKAKDQATKIEKWNDSVDAFIDDPATLNDIPELEGKTEEFREFATQDDNNSVPFKVLVGAFLHEQSKKKVQHKGKMFEKGTGGPNSKPELKNGKITIEEGRKLRETNYPKWKEMLMAGKIQSDF